MSARIDYRRSAPRAGGTPAYLVLRVELSVTHKGEEVWVAQRNWTGDVPADAARALKAIDDVITVVDRSGTFLRLDRLETTMAALHRLPAYASAAPEVRRMMDEASRAAMTREARENWAFLVESWAGMELRLGQEATSEVTMDVPGLAGDVVRARVDRRAKRWVECPGKPATRCMELALRYEPDARDQERVTRALLRKLNPTQPEPGRESPSWSVVEAVLVTEPNGLVPHRLSVKKTPRFAGTAQPDPNGVDEQTWTYTYARPR
jgi:hypothetical protein